MIFEAERWWSYNKSTTVSAEMKIKKERLRNEVTLLKPLIFLLPEVPFQQTFEGFAGPYRSEVFFRISSVFSINWPNP